MKTEYRVDLPAMMRLYETNYAKLVRLMPKRDEVGQVCRYDIQGQEYVLVVRESTRYTTLLDIAQLSPGAAPDYLRANLTVRLYHDARVAEVCTTQQISRLKPRYDYPNPRMHQRDEKHQVNAFLSDWLGHCLRRGVVASDPMYKSSLN
ncbi:DUF1249 family protein [Salinivibrio kushneri]|uniref:DUF1249 family protein n=1 Tax=Salinivibrio kushneri TaxID=1908198 RepID=UPI0022B52928|nr:DUF1249 family protein [Salinivibrio kushneri]WBA17597.1 DUF1249 family protein [Salinivibrio kushneri]